MHKKELENRLYDVRTVIAEITEGTLHHDVRTAIGMLNTLLDGVKHLTDLPRPMIEAAALCQRKAEDYNGGTVSRDAYFPFGLTSYSQMIHTKSLRLVSLAQQGGAANFESARDTALDLINYATFLAEWLDTRKEVNR